MFGEGGRDTKLSISLKINIKRGKGGDRCMRPSDFESSFCPFTSLRPFHGLSTAVRGILLQEVRQLSFDAVSEENKPVG